MPVSYCSNVPAKFTYLRHCPNHSPASSSGFGPPSNTMDTLNVCLDKLMHMMGEEPGQQNPTPTPTPASNMVIAKPQPFDGTCGAAAKAFISQIGLHAITYPKRFPTNARKVVFAVLFMRDYTATCGL
ncbi:uncharacterized protein VP01_3624g2 [Puccinia sorghi]|uniref:Uncharacterized protein n=1 Tax=Puccinia sorghi TaxID=27349 RepID=A0A0L6UWR3_9BASI|nr:uncharacterized protein VP01_3624g2 [Puccinia sorghi]